MCLGDYPSLPTPPTFIVLKTACSERSGQTICAGPAAMPVSSRPTTGKNQGLMDRRSYGGNL